MNPAAVEPPMTAETPDPKVPLRFVIVTFLAAGLVGAAILYFGLGGQLGGPIP